MNFRSQPVNGFLFFFFSPVVLFSFFCFLDARRVTWSYGRDLTLSPKQAAGPVNAMHKVYVEVDGKPFTGWERKFTYRSVTQ